MLHLFRTAVSVILIVAPSTSFSSPNSYKTNCCAVENAPSWLSSYLMSDISAEMEQKMHWVIRRVRVVFHNNKATFASAANLNFSASAFFSPMGQVIEFSPQPNLETFAPIFRHELAHVISNQKFKGAIPRWLEEGFANFLGSRHDVDYKWLAAQTLPNASELGHPSTDASGSKMHYLLSTATVEMIAGTCNLDDLLMLATGSKLTNYLETFCKIKDVNKSVRGWITGKAKAK